MMRLFFLLVALLAGGCAELSTSSASSASLSSISASSQSSTGKRQAYLGDVRAAAQLAAASTQPLDELLVRVGRLATQSGVLDWEADPETCLAIAQGLHAAGLDEEEAGHLLLGQRSASLILDGYPS